MALIPASESQVADIIASLRAGTGIPPGVVLDFGIPPYYFLIEGYTGVPVIRPPFSDEELAWLWALTAGAASIAIAPSGTITVTPEIGPTETVTFNADGTISTTYGSPRSTTVTTTFHPDGTITEVAS